MINDIYYPIFNSYLSMHMQKPVHSMKSVSEVPTQDVYHLHRPFNFIYFEGRNYKIQILQLFSFFF